MRLSELNKIAKSLSKDQDPEVRIVTDGGFLNILEIVPRSEYYDESLHTGSVFEKGDFLCIEIDWRWRE